MQRTALPSGNLRSLSELKKRIFFLIGALLVYRIGAQIPVPGLDPARLAELFSGNRGILELFNLFSSTRICLSTLSSNR